MATFSGGMKLKSKFKLNDDMMKVIDSTIAKEVRKVQSFGEEVMKSLREEIVNSWFGKFDSSSMNFCTEYSSSYRQDGDKVVITITSYVNVDKYQELKYRSADRWAEKWNDESFEKSPGEYILNLQYEEGIIGLPKKATFRKDSDWENTNFHQFDPLSTVLENELKKRWNKEIKKRWKNI